MKVLLSLLPVVALSAMPAMASPILLQNATATFSQTQSDLVVGQTIDETTTGFNGWAIDPDESNPQGETAVWTTATDLGEGAGTSFKFTIIQNFSGGYSLGHFRLSVTTDPRSTFANGLDTGGDVTANWIELAPSSASDAGSGTEMFTINLDHTISVTGAQPDTATYVVTANTSTIGITGIRLETLKYTSPLEGDGPGRSTAQNGNFVLTEFQVDAEVLPEPASLSVLILGGLPVLLRRPVRR